MQKLRHTDVPSTGGLHSSWCKLQSSPVRLGSLFQGQHQQPDTKMHGLCIMLFQIVAPYIHLQPLVGVTSVHDQEIVPLRVSTTAEPVWLTNDDQTCAVQNMLPSAERWHTHMALLKTHGCTHLMRLVPTILHSRSDGHSQPVHSARKQRHDAVAQHCVVGIG